MENNTKGAHIHTTIGANGKSRTIKISFYNPDEWKKYGNLKKRIKKLSNSLEGFTKHLYGKDGVCDVCHAPFLMKHGWKIDEKEIIVCEKCMHAINEEMSFFKSKKNRSVRAISTPMGNKQR